MNPPALSIFFFAKENTGLLRALCFSITCHVALLWGSAPRLMPPLPPTPVPINVRLAQPKAAQNKIPPLLLPKNPVAKSFQNPFPQPTKPKKARENSVVDWQKNLKTQLKKQQEEGLYYPEAAITQGLEGSVLVLMVLDAQGNVVAARIEQSSGNALLDQAAIRAVRALKTLPSDAPREVILPLSFRLSP